MFKKGDVLQNKFGNPPVRLLEETWHGETRLLGVSPSGHVAPTGISEALYVKVSYWKWLRVTLPYILKWFYYIWCYKQDKKLGLVEIMTPSDFWKRHPPGYKEYYVTTTDYGFLSYPKKMTALNYPVWREQHFYPHFEVNLPEWLWRRTKHILPTWLL